MTNEERDRLLYEIHAEISTIAAQCADHHRTLYGNGQEGLRSSLQAVKMRQEECPARKAAMPGQRANVISAFALCVMAITLALEIADII